MQRFVYWSTKYFSWAAQSTLWLEIKMEWRNNMRCLVQKGDDCECWCDTDHEGNNDYDSYNHDISNDGNNVDQLLLIIVMMMIMIIVIHILMMKMNSVMMIK